MFIFLHTHVDCSCHSEPAVHLHICLLSASVQQKPGAALVTCPPPQTPTPLSFKYLHTHVPMIQLTVSHLYYRRCQQLTARASYWFTKTLNKRERKRKEERRAEEKRGQEASLTWTDGWWMECDQASCTYTHTAWLSNDWKLQLIKYGFKCVKKIRHVYVPLPPTAEIIFWQFIVKQRPTGWLLCSQQCLCWWGTGPCCWHLTCLNYTRTHTCIQMANQYCVKELYQNRSADHWRNITGTRRRHVNIFYF